MSTARYGLPAAARVRDGRDFRRIYRHGRRAHGPSMVVVGLPRREPGMRLGVSVSKDHGGAVRRNKIKRLLREAFRLERPELPGAFDLVLIPRPAEAKLDLAELRRELRRLVRELIERPRPNRPPGPRTGPKRGRGRDKGKDAGKGRSARKPGGAGNGSAGREARS